MLSRILAVLLFAAIATSAAAQPNFPLKPIRFVVPYPPGGFTDILARVIGQKLFEGAGQPAVIENKGGGGSTIGTDLVAKSPPDGYTILMVAPDLAINTSLYAKLPYDAARDFAPVTQVAWGPIALVVHPSVSAASLAEFIALAKTTPRALNYASGGNGTAGHLAMELFKTTAGISLVHVPYKGIAPAGTDLLSGQVSLMFLQMALARPHILSGRLRALAVAGGQRSAALPDVPTLAEAGLPGVEVNPWFGVVAPAGTPPDIVARLSVEIGRIMRLAEVRERISAQGGEPVSSTPEEFRAFVKAEIVKWAGVVKASGARVD
ncbi:MAG: tripartite tricarboxylate transporter substrate binding protein [Betaproteobacteria bacterium]|nr:tripartite tricarboxylate transporter substrate binding protein [Betaproteobacteria bacterium]